MDESTSTSHKKTAPSWDMAAVSLLSLWLAYWFIPAHVPHADALGLPPALLPTAAALGIAALSAIGFLLSLLRQTRTLEMSGTPWRPVLFIMALGALGVSFISYAGLSIGAIFLIPAFMRLLGERRWTRILLTTLIIAALIYFVVP